jgi:hypothetical protein
MATIRTVYFAGPSLYGVAVDKLPNELWLPPAKQGDVVQAIVAIRPRQVVLIDGVFHQSMSVWHKEIGYALMRGVAVIGAASMGALRAAEMHRYGVVGVGKIFEMYRDGEENDALVALKFDPETYRPISEPPIGQALKQADALEAIEFARSYRGRVQTSLTVDAISPFFERVILSTLEKDYGRRRSYSKF